MATHPFNDNDGKVALHDNLNGQVFSVDEKIIPSGVGRVIMGAQLQNFTIDSTKLKKAHRDFLADTVAPLLKGNNALVCKITGVASNDKAGAAYNQQKGRQRAGEVHGFLSVTQSVKVEQLKVQEKGDVRGIFGVQDDQNRAVDLQVIEMVSQQFSIRLINALEVWRRLKLPPTKDMDQAAFLVTDRVNQSSAVFLFAEDRPSEMDKITITPRPITDEGRFVSLQQPASPVDFTGALVSFFEPEQSLPRTPTTLLTASFVGSKIGSFNLNLPVEDVEWNERRFTTPGRLIRARAGQTPSSAR